MKRLFALLSAFFCFGGHAWAGAYEDGLAAMRKGDYAAAVEKYREAGLQNDARAQLDLGVMYDTGKGVKKNYKEAIKWYRLAASQGVTIAHYNLGVMHYAGLGVRKNIDEAAKWFGFAAEKGDREAVKWLEKVERQRAAGLAADPFDPEPEKRPARDVKTNQKEKTKEVAQR